jgi:hypothetical protein
MTDTDRVARLFTRENGDFHFARWGRALAPVTFGTNDEGAEIVERALADVAGLAGLPMAGTDPELGANLMTFFCEEWVELGGVPTLDRLIPGLPQLISVLAAAGANQYRIFGFDENGAIRICLILLRYDADLRSVSAQTLAMGQAAQSILLWSEAAFRAETPVALIPGSGRAVVKPWFADLVRAAYDPVLPCAAEDAAFAFRLSARMEAMAAQRRD